MTNPMPTFTVLRNGLFVGEIRAVSLKQAVARARGRYGRVEVLAASIARHADAHHGPDAHRTEGRRPCNPQADRKARIEAIRKAAIADWEASR